MYIVVVRRRDVDPTTATESAYAAGCEHDTR